MKTPKVFYCVNNIFFVCSIYISEQAITGLQKENQYPC